jgi:hypothetical protein
MSATPFESKINLRERNNHGYGTATEWITEGSELSSSGVKNFLFSMLSKPTLGSSQLPIQWVPGALSQGVKRPGPEADHSPPASAEVKKCGSTHPLPHTPLWRSV